MHVALVIMHGFGSEMAKIALGNENESHRLAVKMGLTGIAAVVVFHVAATQLSLSQPMRGKKQFETGIDRLRRFLYHHWRSKQNYNRRSSYARINGRPPRDAAFQRLLSTNFEDFRLEIGGLVERPLSLSPDELRRLPKKTQATLHTCIQGWTFFAQWGGAAVSDLIELCRPSAGGKYLVFRTMLIGERFLGKYTSLITSGTTGTPGVFVLDDRNVAVTSALVLSMMSAWLRIGDIFKIIARGGRVTLVCATCGHYAEAVAGARLRKWRGDKAVQILPAQAPLPEIVAQLNRFRPAVLATYASIGALLAGEQAAGRLRINPSLVMLLAEGLPAGGYDRIARAFNIEVHHSYAATECPFISYNCDLGWLHVNSDWVLLEPVDAEYRPTPQGERSHTVLISNLANRAQPILRYDLGDRILQRPDPCPCGDPLPAIRVEGRTADLLTFSTESGEQVSIPALMFEIVDAIGVELFQIVQTSPTSLRVRFRPAAGAAPDQVWRAAHTEIARVLAEQRLTHVAIERAEEPPEQSPGGKYRPVIPLR